MFGIGLYKWRDDKWLRGSSYERGAATAVGTYIGISQLLLLAFDILVGLVYDWFIAAVLLVLHASGLVVMAALVVWVLHDFYLPRKWRNVVGVLFVFVIAGGIAGAIIGQGRTHSCRSHAVGARCLSSCCPPRFLPCTQNCSVATSTLRRR